MTTNLDIIKRAMKKLHVLAAGTDPSSPQAADGMDALQSLIVEMVGQGSLGRLTDVLATADYTANEFERIQASNGVTITLPTVITPTLSPSGLLGNWVALSNWVGFWDYGNVYRGSNRPPVDRACVVVVQNNAASNYIFRSQTNAWVQIDNLTQQGNFPLANYLEDGFAALLAERLQDDYQTQIGPATQRAANTCRWMLSAKPDSASAPVPAEYF